MENCDIDEHWVRAAIQTYLLCGIPPYSKMCFTVQSVNNDGLSVDSETECTAPGSIEAVPTTQSLTTAPDNSAVSLTFPLSTCPPVNNNIRYGIGFCPKEVQSASRLFDIRKSPGSGTFVEMYSVGAGGILSVAWKSSRNISILQWQQRKTVAASSARFLWEPVTKRPQYHIRSPTGIFSDFLVAKWNGTLQTAVLTIANRTRHPWNVYKNAGSRLQLKQHHETLYKICMTVDEENGGSKTGTQQEYCLAASRDSVGLETIDTCTTSRCIFTLCEEKRLAGGYRYSDCWWTK